MHTKKYVFEIPYSLKAFSDGYQGIWRNQIIEAFLTTAYHWKDNSKIDYRTVFIEVYYQNYIDPLENDFETIPDDPYYRDQLTFYMALQEEITLMTKDGTLESILRKLREQWQNYINPGEFFTEMIDSRKYIVYQ